MLTLIERELNISSLLSDTRIPSILSALNLYSEKVWPKLYVHKITLAYYTQISDSIQKSGSLWILWFDVAVLAWMIRGVVYEVQSNDSNK